MAVRAAAIAADAGEAGAGGGGRVVWRTGEWYGGERGARRACSSTRCCMYWKRIQDLTCFSTLVGTLRAESAGMRSAGGCEQGGGSRWQRR